MRVNKTRSKDIISQLKPKVDSGDQRQRQQECLNEAKACRSGCKLHLPGCP